MTTSPQPVERNAASLQAESAEALSDAAATSARTVIGSHGTRTAADAPEDSYHGADGDSDDAMVEADASRVGEYIALPGIPGRGVTLLSLLAIAACAGLDLILTRGITMFFDLCFVVVCLVAAMGVRRRDLFTTGVLPPLLFAAVVAGVAFVSPGTFVQVGGAFKAFMTGLAEHAPGLVAGYAVALAAVGARVTGPQVTGSRASRGDR